MNASASGLSRRFLNVKIAIGRRVLGMATGRGRIVGNHDMLRARTRARARYAV
jgi:hypothetical protein